jgi:hypothetical protein
VKVVCIHHVKFITITAWRIWTPGLLLVQREIIVHSIINTINSTVLRWIFSSLSTHTLFTPGDTTGLLPELVPSLEKVEIVHAFRFDP